MTRTSYEWAEEIVARFEANYSHYRSLGFRDARAGSDSSDPLDRYVVVSMTPETADKLLSLKPDEAPDG